MLRINQQGYTLIELLMAMAIFSFMLMFISMGFIEVMKLHHNAVVTRSSQENNRYGLEDIVRAGRGAYHADIVNAHVGSPSPAAFDKLCFYSSGGGTAFWVSGGRLFKGDFGVVDPTRPGGSCASVTATNNTEISSGEIAIVDLTATKVGATPPESVEATVQTGPTDASLLNLSDSSHIFCRPGLGANFCSTAAFTSSVSLRGAP